MILRLITLIALGSLTMCQNPSLAIILKEKERGVKTNNKERQNNAAPKVLKPFGLNDCLKFYSRLHPEIEKYLTETEHNKKQKIEELCKPCLISSLSGWCINCCKDFIFSKKRKPIKTD